MNQAPIKYGIIGFGGIAEKRIALEGFACDQTRFQPLPEAQLVATTDRNPARKPAATALGLHWYDSAEEMLTDQSLQAVFIATNNASHVPMALQAIQAGKHVLVEKPLATSAQDAAKLIAAATEKGLSLYVDHMMTGNAWNRLAKTMVAKGTLGHVNDAVFHMEFPFGYEPDEAKSWRCSSVAEMGGPIGDVASHCFYLAEDILDARIAKLAAVYLPKTMAIATENGAVIKAFLDNGCHLTVRASFSDLRGGPQGVLGNLGYEIYGDKGVLRGFGTMFQLSGHAGEPYSVQLLLDDFSGNFKPLIPPQSDIQNIYQRVIRTHANSILTGTPLAGGDALHNLLLCEASHASALANGKILTIA